MILFCTYDLVHCLNLKLRSIDTGYYFLSRTYGKTSVLFLN